MSKVSKIKEEVPDGKYRTGTGQLIRCHKKADCSGACPIHSPSDHHMKDWPTNWRGDKGIMERICEHGVGHPDPDDINCKKHAYLTIHGCDGCCNPKNRK